MKKNLFRCPSCSGTLKISQYHCPSCGIDINGEIEGCMFCNLDDEDRYFALVFLQTGGNIRDVERVMGISYPTVKAKLAQLLKHLGVSSDENHSERVRHHFGDRMRERHNHREEVRRLKKELKAKIRKDVHRSIRGVIEPLIEFHNGENRASKAQMETDNEFQSEISEVLGDLNEGRIDVGAALKRLRKDKSEEQEEEEKEEEAEKVENKPSDESGDVE